jgi:hypothetical protein
MAKHCRRLLSEKGNETYMSAAIETPVQESETPEFEQSALSVRDEAMLIVITDQPSYDAAAAKFTAVTALEKEIAGHYAPLKQKAHESHKAICDAEKTMLGPVQDAKRILSRAIGAFDEEQERKRREEQRKLEAEARKREEEERIAAAVEVEQMGASEEEVEAVLSTPAPAMKIQAPPTYQRAAAIATREVWSAELTDFPALVKAATENPAYLIYLEANTTQLNSTARSQKSAMRVPGVKAVSERIAAGKGR